METDLLERLGESTSQCVRHDEYGDDLVDDRQEFKQRRVIQYCRVNMLQMDDGRHLPKLVLLCVFVII